MKILIYIFIFSTVTSISLGKTNQDFEQLEDYFFTFKDQSFAIWASGYRYSVMKCSYKMPRGEAKQVCRTKINGYISKLKKLNRELKSFYFQLNEIEKDTFRDDYIFSYKKSLDYIEELQKQDLKLFDRF